MPDGLSHHSPEKVEGLRAYHELQEFITKMWCHPLVDRFTADRRKWFKERAVETLGSFQADYLPRKLALLPVGSLSWIQALEEASDIDVICIYEADNRMNIEDATQQPTHPKLDIRLNRHLYSLSTVQTPADVMAIIDIMLIPDDFIAGNIGIARGLRLRVARILSTNSDMQRLLSEVFEEYYKGWASLNGMGNKEKRMSRYYQQLKRRYSTSQTAQSFDVSKGDLKLPDIQTYLKGLLASNGALELDRQYAAQGVLDEEGNDPNESTNPLVKRHVEVVKANDHYKRRIQESKDGT